MSFKNLQTFYSSPRSQVFQSKDDPYIVKCNFSQNMNTLNLFNSKNMKLGKLGDVNPFDTKKIFRKYYGKKISNVACLDQDFPKNLSLACKRVQKLRLQNSLSVRAHFPVLRDLEFLCDNSLCTLRKLPLIHKLLFQSKLIKNFTMDYLYKELSFKSLRILNKLQTLSFTLFSDDFSPFYKSIKRVHTIQKLSLKIRRSSELRITNNTNNFIKGMGYLLVHNKIHTLKLSFTEGWLEPDFIEKLFSIINRYQVSSWYIQANVVGADLFQSKNPEVSQFFSSVDFLWLNGKPDLYESTRPLFCPIDFKRPPELCSIIKDQRKVLDLEILTNIKIDVAAILHSFEKLEGIYIKGRIIITSTLNGISCLSTLKYVSLEFNDFNDLGRMKATKDILEVLKEAPSLETLKLNCMNQPEQYKKNQDKDYEEHLTTLAKLSLKRLDLHIYIPSFNILTKMPQLLIPLQNLRRLSLDFQNTIEEFPNVIPFAQLTHLEQLKLSLPFNLKSYGFINQLINSIPNLVELQTLDIEYPKSNNPPHQLYRLILKNLRNLRKLKKVCICIIIVSPQDSHLIKKEVFELAQANPSVEMIRIYNVTWYEILYRSY